MEDFKSTFLNESGQGLVEYSLVISLVALAVIGMVIVFGESLFDLFETIKNDLINVL